MNLNQLIYFETLARLQHYTQASEALHISQPSLSKAIANLERELGVYLFEKRGRNVVLTKPGKIYLEAVQKALRELEEGRQRLSRLQAETDSEMDIGFVSSLQFQAMPALLQAYRRDTGSATRFACHEGTTVTLLEELREGNLDLVFGSEPEAAETFEYYPVFRQELVVLTPDSEHWRQMESITLEQAVKEPLILHTVNTGMRRIVLDLFASRKLQPVIAQEATEESMLASLVAMEQGIAVVSLSPAVMNPHVRILRLEHPQNFRYIMMISLKNRPLSPSVRHFRSYVLSAAKAGVLQQLCR